MSIQKTASLDDYEVSEMLVKMDASEVIKEEGEERQEGDNEIGPISTNFPRKRIGCCRCPVNLRKLPDPNKLPDISIRIN